MDTLSEVHWSDPEFLDWEWGLVEGFEYGQEMPLYGDRVQFFSAFAGPSMDAMRRNRFMSDTHPRLLFSLEHDFYDRSDNLEYYSNFDTPSAYGTVNPPGMYRVLTSEYRELHEGKVFL